MSKGSKLPPIRPFLVFFAACGWLSCASPAQATPAQATPVLRWCMDHFTGFHEFHGNSATPVGPSVDMMQELAKRAGFSLKTTGRTPSRRCLKQLAEGDAELMTNLLYSVNSAASLTLIRFASRHPDRLYLQSSHTGHITDLAQLNSLSLVTVQGFGLHPAIQQVVNALPQGQKQRVKSTETALFMVARGRADGALLPTSQVQRIFRQQPALQLQLREVSFNKDVVVPQDVYLGLSRHLPDPTLEERIRRTLIEMKNDGSLQRLFGATLQP